ncbi:DNA mismatch repair protein pms1 [Diaporthe eres]|uniref:DNA mismatch repair protein pms1 n=2 Tax=Diaporthe vaccinii TaxID=105482 RepID=A0ABR4EJJ4_9PEZI|nr:DNA mismatch repair protein pms1 [Diaporthe eres]
MATIKAIEASSVHQIQSGQVIVDLCSVAKELVENGLDAGATSIDVRFKNQGLDLIEVQDNGTGISPENHESLALKHYTSKLSTYSDLSTLETFGFRGEALSSLCALSKFAVVTCLQADAPKGSKLEFETSGKLRSTSVVAAQKGTTVSVENLFKNLPVRRRELERNIKREWGKVISLLNQYACIQTGVKFTVSQQPNKGKRIVLFSTKGNKSTRENIVNVFGAKTMAGLVVLDLKLDLEPTSGLTQKRSTQKDGDTHEVLIRGHVSRPVHGEGRQTPDRQMFYVNSRPCGLPQFAKVFNEVYRLYNSSQSPFIFADIQLDTHLYDVNVSPDKRTILLHDQGRMLDNLRESLVELFEKQEYTVPVSQIATSKLPPFKKLTVSREDTNGSEGDSADKSSATVDQVVNDPARDGEEMSDDEEDTSGARRIKNLASAKALSRNAQLNPMTRWLDRKLASREDASSEPGGTAKVNPSETVTEQTSAAIPGKCVIDIPEAPSMPDEQAPQESIDGQVPPADTGEGEEAFLSRLARMKRSFLPESLRDEHPYDQAPTEPPIPAIAKPSKPIDTAPLSVHASRPPKPPSQEVATITIGDQSVTSVIGTPAKRPRVDDAVAQQRKAVAAPQATAPLPSFGGRLTQMFSAASPSQNTPRGDESLHTQRSNNFGEGDESDEADGDEEDEEDEDEGRSEDDSVSDAEAAPDHENGVDSDSEASASSALFVEQDEDDDAEAPEQDEDDNGASASPAPESQREALDEDDGEYIDENEFKAREELELQKTLTAAEGVGHEPSEENQKRTQAFLKGSGKNKHSTQALLQRLHVDEDWLQKRLELWESQTRDYSSAGQVHASEDMDPGLEAGTQVAEDKLSLTIHKGDFSKMKIVGQFNLGFILAVRPGTSAALSTATAAARADNTWDDDELFIIDQHASDEKFNFERLQASTTVQSQRLVRPKPLELTAVEEEIVIENRPALEANGFQVEADTSGDEPVGSRCRLLSLPLSRETTFSLADLEELISLLGDSPATTSSPALDGEGESDGNDDGGHHGGVTGTRRYIPRPSKVRKMFAMRACRSSVMIGKALSHRQMEKVIRHMGDMEKPWNCPHGRPTMRHLCALGAAWDEKGWAEGDHGNGDAGRTTDWAGYVSRMRQ